MLITQYALVTQCTTVLRGDAQLVLWYSSVRPPASVRDPACIGDPAFIRTNEVWRPACIRGNTVCKQFYSWLKSFKNDDGHNAAMWLFMWGSCTLVVLYPSRVECALYTIFMYIVRYIEYIVFVSSLLWAVHCDILRQCFLLLIIPDCALLQEILVCHYQSGESIK